MTLNVIDGRVTVQHGQLATLELAPRLERRRAAAAAALLRG